MDNNKLKKLAVNLSEIMEGQFNTPQKTFDEFQVIYQNQKEYFSRFSSSDLIKLIFYIFSYKETGGMKLADNILNNLAFASLFYTSGNYYHDTCDNCEGNGYERCDECNGHGEVDCSTCDGSGEDDGEPCYDCQGDGQVMCNNCGGDGDINCSDCDGEGDIETDRLELEHYQICTWDSGIKTQCELEEGTKEPAMSEYDFDRLRDEYIILSQSDLNAELRNFVEIDEVYCLSYSDELKLFHNPNYFMFFWDDRENFNNYIL
jgi:hypothetical protein